MTNYNNVVADVMELHDELKEIISELDAVYDVFMTGLDLGGGGEIDPVCGKMAVSGYIEVSEKLSRLAKYNAGVVFYEMGDEK